MEYFDFRTFEAFFSFQDHKFEEGDQHRQVLDPGMRKWQWVRLPKRLYASILIVHQHEFDKHELIHLRQNQESSFYFLSSKAEFRFVP